MINVRSLHNCEIQGWKLGEIIGEGADGIVYKGEKNSLVKAVKIFFPDVLQDNGFEAGLERLALQLTLKGQHPNLVEICEGGEAPEVNSLYLVMQLVPGSTLDKAIKHIPEENIPSLIKQLADAAKYLEELDIAHRDIKPTNIIISKDFTKLTLLDLGVALRTAEEIERLSGDKFVGTTRYSPHEFVWRSEENSNKLAWRAITFYQIGATLHDMVMKYPIFTGNDQPRAVLYESIKHLPPTIQSATCPKWLIQLAQTCLLKNWRERVNLLTWDSFSEFNENIPNTDALANKIRLKQILNEELKEGALYLESTTQHHGNDKGTEIWTLNNDVFLEIRHFLMNASIFPRFASYTTKNMSKFEFDEDENLMFKNPFAIEVKYESSKDFASMTLMTLIAIDSNNTIVYEASWNEVLTVESCARRIQQSMLEIADMIVNQNN